MRIRMLHSVVGSPDDGMNNYHYEQGREYEASEPLDYHTRPLPISKQLAQEFITFGLAVDADEPTPTEPEPEPATEVPAEPAAEEAPAPAQE